MPRWACRLVLEIVNVRLEPLNAISIEDACAEGWPTEYAKSHAAEKCYPIAWYGALWDSINAKRGFGWDKNPWVWVIEFRRLSS
jgi:hypothetical protein